jgi:hypothetical protein
MPGGGHQHTTRFARFMHQTATHHVGVCVDCPVASPQQRVLGALSGLHALLQLQGVAHTAHNNRGRSSEAARNRGITSPSGF